MHDFSYKYLIVISLLMTYSTFAFGQQSGPFVSLHDLVPPGEGELTFYGRKVAIDKDVVLAGSEAGNNVQVVDFTSGENTWTFQSKTPETTLWGYSVSIFENSIAIGDAGDGPAGGQGVITQGFATSLDVDLDVLMSNVDTFNLDPVLGEVLIIDDPTVNLPLLANQFERNSEFGHDVARSKNFLLVGEPFQSSRLNTLTPRAGRAHLFFQDTPIHDYQNPNPNVGDAFGAYVAIEEFGTEVFIAISAHRSDAMPGDDAGRVYLYEVNSGNQPIHVFSRAGSVEFGQDVDIDDGRLLIKYDGGAELYDLTSAGYPRVAEFSHPEPANPPFIFKSETCEISGDRVVLGVPGSYFDGRIYVYDSKSPNTPKQVIEDPTVSPLPGNVSNPTVSFQDVESWPTSIALWGGRLVVGSPIHSEDAFYQGQVNIFYVPGDVNHDGFVNTSDIDPFVEVFSNMEYLLEADIDQDGVLTGLDSELLVDLILNQN